MKKTPQKGTVEYYTEAVNFSNEIIKKTPTIISFVLSIISILSVLSIVIFISLQLLHSDILYRKHTHSEDVKFILFLLVVWLPLTVIGLFWLIIHYAKYYSEFMIVKIKNNQKY